MSDFVISSQVRLLDRLMEGFLKVGVPSKDIRVWTGDWGVLLLSSSTYSGYAPVETDEYIFAVIGGPVIDGTNGSVTNGLQDDSYKTRLIYENWISGEAYVSRFDGPFIIIYIDKATCGFTVITDKMLFIPVYRYSIESLLVVGSHVDIVAYGAGAQRSFDPVSLADFLLNNVVTFPYTVYQGVEQFQPGSISNFIIKPESKPHYTELETKVYWAPAEGVAAYKNIDEAAYALKIGIEKYMGRVAQKDSQVAQFLSGGEDSRVIAGILYSRKLKDAYISVDSFGDETLLASKVAEIYNLEFNPHLRSKSFYIDILSDATKLAGTGHQYRHAHSLIFRQTFMEKKYTAVFGGYLADTLIKACYAPTLPQGFLGNIPFIPKLLRSPSKLGSAQSSMIPEHLLELVNGRRQQHFDRLAMLRPNSALEWFAFWPATMRRTMTNFYASRRLCASYEPFMSNASLYVSASAPTAWKINGRLFHRAFKDYLKIAGMTRSSSGKIPAVSPFLSMSAQAFLWSCQTFKRKLKFEKNNNNCWPDWGSFVQLKEWRDAIADANTYLESCDSLTSEEKAMLVAFLSPSRSLDGEMNALELIDSIKSLRE